MAVEKILVNIVQRHRSRNHSMHTTVGSRETLIDVAGAINIAGIKPVIDRVFNFAHAREALAHLDSGSHFGKVVIRCS